MNRTQSALACLSILLCAATGCVGTTGGDVVSFDAYAAGAQADDDGVLRFESGRGYQVELDRAQLFVGAMYLNRSRPTAVTSDTSCTLAGIYVAEVTSGRTIDALDATPQPFPVAGTATTDRALTGELWLSGGDIDAIHDPTVILDLAGVASRDGETFPFEGTITIGENRVVVPDDPAQPGRKPICKQRVVTPILVDLVPEEGGALLLRVDPRGWFGNVDFRRLGQVAEQPPLYRVADEESDPASNSLYDGLHAAGGVYSFEWID
jgi:hypothetical protein